MIMLTQTYPRTMSWAAFIFTALLAAKGLG